MLIAEYFRRSRGELRSKRWIAVAFLLILGGTNAALALSHPPVGRAAIVFVAAAVVRVFALVWISLAALRGAVGGPRRRWMPDGAFWLYLLLSLLALAGTMLAGYASLALPDSAREAAMYLVGVLIVLPFAPWLVAAAVERPIAWSPSPWLTRFGDWLGPLVALSLLTVFPLTWLHAWLSAWLIAMAGHPGFVELALADALLSTFLVLWTLALQLTAYRRVAQR